VKAFYTIDRTKRLDTGMQIEMQSHRVDPGVFLSHISTLYPDGLSEHGMSYISTHESRFECGDSAIELYFEEVRRSCYPEQPSRYVSMFCCESLSDIPDMKRRLQAPSSPVYEVHVSGRWHRAYWKGEEGFTGEQPMWEIVAELPVHIGKRIE
jgi:hypothetical protein